MLLADWERWNVRGDCKAGPGGGADKLTEVSWVDSKRQGSWNNCFNQFYL